MIKPYTNIIPAALLIVSTVVIWAPKARIPPMPLIFLVLSLMNVATIVWRLHKARVLNLTPGQIYGLPSRPKFTALDMCANVMALVATFKLSP